ncbi:MAG TPA: hypothetical protein PLN06_03170 [Bacteroidales bacterium]|nr:hypothetical protein [Bacteroidales bacterium]HQG36615.1 hypothetical protein [Bacteroidales bacterium]HQG53213.1 hypothetical protein [Bacteroidales bacterium]HQJ20593.1 hypothetical protein [Bacteroidales bacterium]
MAQEGKRWLDIILDSVKKICNRNLAVFLFFLLISFILWYINSLRKEMEIEIRYPITFINTPPGVVVSNSLTGNVVIKLNGTGYSIIKNRFLSSRSPVVIDLNSVRLNKFTDKNGTQKYFITVGEIQHIFINRFRPDFQVLSVKPDTLFFEIGTDLNTEAVK